MTASDRSRSPRARRGGRLAAVILVVLAVLSAATLVLLKSWTFRGR